MTSPRIARIAEIDDQLKKLERIASRGDYVAAGLELSITVGPASAKPTPDLQCQVTFELDDLLALLRKSLEGSRKLNLSFLRSEIKDLTTYLGDTPPAKS